MPRVKLVTKSAAGRTYACTKCSKPILPKQKFYTWKFRYGGTRRQHESCGYPTAGQLTQSKLSTVYDAQDGARGSVAEADNPTDMADALRSLAETAREVCEEYREAVQAMNMEGAGTENEERADALESYADEVEGAADELEGEEWEADEEATRDAIGGEDGYVFNAEDEGAVSSEGQTREDWLADMVSRAEEAIDSLGL